MTWPRIALMCCAVVIQLGAVGPAATFVGTSVGPQIAAAALRIDGEELAFMDLINAYRRTNGAGPLSLSLRLTVASEGHSRDMASRTYFSHESLDGRTPWERMRAAGYRFSAPMGENLAVGFNSADTVFEGWKASPGHNRNMLDPDFVTVGVARVLSPVNSLYYWTTDFGGFDDSVAERLAGLSSAQTAVAISNEGWADGSDAVVIARDDHFSDALAGSPLAAYLANRHGAPAPTLLTDRRGLSRDVKEEIARLKATHVYLLGGRAALEPRVEADARSIPSVQAVERVWGETAFGTAQAIRAEMDEVSRGAGIPGLKTAVITTGLDFPDALAIAGPAASKGMPILLVRPFAAEPEPETLPALTGIDRVIIVGGPGAVHPDLEVWLNEHGHKVVTRLWGVDEYETAVDILNDGAAIFGFDVSKVLVARGDFFTDALAGGTFAAFGPHPMLLVRPGSIPEPTKAWILSRVSSIDKTYILGGFMAVKDGVKNGVEALFIN